MPIYDYHRRVLSPTVWKVDELRPAPRVRKQLRNQLRTRFPQAGRVFIAGDLAGHYYHEASPLDLILLVPPNTVNDYRREAEVVNGYLLDGTEHGVYFHILPDTVKPELLGEKFGPVFDISMDRWFGKRVTGNTELTRPDALLQHIKWKLYKVKEYDQEVYPYQWEILGEAVRHLSQAGRQQLKDELKQVVARMERGIGKVLKTYQDPAIWRNASALQNLLHDDYDGEDIFGYVQANKIPTPVVLAMLNVLRYEDVLEAVTEIDEHIQEETEAQSMMSGVQLQQITGTTHKKAGRAASEYLWKRLANLVDLVILQNGGYGNAVETVVQVVERILENSRYMNTGPRRRQVALRLYKKFYRHMKSPATKKKWG